MFRFILLFHLLVYLCLGDAEGVHERESEHFLAAAGSLCGLHSEERDVLLLVIDIAEGLAQLLPERGVTAVGDYHQARHFLFRKQEADQVGQHGTFRLSLLPRGDAVDDKLAQLF